MAPFKQKRCCVPYCSNIQGTSKKQFFKIGANLESRENPFSLPICVGKALAAKSQVLYCCEDHFDLPNDAENYIRCKYLSGTKLKLRPNVLPQKKLPLNVCRLCLKLIFNGDDFVHISKKKEAKNAQIIAATLPELDLSITVDPVACIKCFNPLERYYRIKQNALHTEVVVVNCIKAIVKRSPTRLVKNCEIDLFEEYNDIVELLEKEKEKINTMEEPRNSEVMQDLQEMDKSAEEIVIQLEEPSNDKYDEETVHENIFESDQSHLHNILEGGNNSRPLEISSFEQHNFSVNENALCNKVPGSSVSEDNHQKTVFHISSVESLQNIPSSSVESAGNLKYEIVEGPMELSSENVYIHIEKESPENVVIVTSHL